MCVCARARVYARAVVCVCFFISWHNKTNLKKRPTIFGHEQVCREFSYNAPLRGKLQQAIICQYIDI